MKPAAAILALTLCFATAARLSAQNYLSADSLTLGTGNDITTHGTFGVAIGDSNTVNDDGNHFLFVGSNNYAYFAYDGLVVGSQNEGDFDTMICVGSNNDSVSPMSLVVGGFNYASIYGGMLVGTNNAIDGRAQFALGKGLVNHSNTWAMDAISIYLGQYNVSDESSTPPLLVVGNGTDATHPSDALIIQRDGKIKIPKRQGDIVMGEFGNGNGD